MSLKKWAVTIIILTIICIPFSTAKAKKSVFIISKHSTPSQAQAYAINGTQVDYQAQVDIDTYNPGYGAVGNAVWPEKGLMFVTYEDSPMVVWASTKTLQKVGEFDTNMPNFNGAGIACDRTKEKIYLIDRDKDDLYVYSFDEANNTLVLDNHYDLDVPSGSLSAWGIALDETNGLLYVSTDTKTVHVYDTSDWSHDHSIDISVSGTNRSAVGIAVDPANGCLYTGHWHYHNYLVRTNTSSPYTSIEVEIEGQPLIGVDVDEDTGYVYCTTYHNDFRVYEYDSDLVLQDTETNEYISGPGGVAVGGWYKPHLFDIVKDDNDVNCVYPLISEEEHELTGTPYNWLYYNIAWNANGYADSNVVIVDYLPKGVDEPNLISDGGVYDSNEHTVTWDIGDIGANDSDEFQIRVGVNNRAKPGGFITNKVEMEGDEYLTPATQDTNVCFWGNEIIYVDQDANGFNNGTSWDDAYNLLQDGFTGARNSGALVTEIWVAARTYKPVWEMDEQNQYKQESFELPEDVGLFGHFGGVGTYETSTSQRDFADANNETILEGQIGDGSSEGVCYVVDVEGIEDAIIDGFTITGAVSNGPLSGAGIYLYNANIAIVNCNLKNKRSHGIYARYNSSADIHNCTFIDNTSDRILPSILSHSSQMDISYCIFDGDSNIIGGIRLESGSIINVSDSIFKNHRTYGIYCHGSNLTLKNSVIRHSGDEGIYCYRSNLTLKNSVIRHSGDEGIYLGFNLNTIIINNWIHDNGAAGIYFYDPDPTPLVRNNTIYNNSTYGIKLQYGTADPSILNCIIYENDINDLYRVDGTFDTVNYCNLQNPHPTGTGNITGNLR